MTTASHRPALLPRALLLAALLHVWGVLMFGNATGNAAPGQGVWGRLTVQLRGTADGTPGLPPSAAAPSSARDNAAPGSAAQTRQGGQVRAAPPVADTPGASEIGRWNAQAVAPEQAQSEVATPAPPQLSRLRLPEGFQPVARSELQRPAPLPDLPSPAADLPTELPPVTSRLEAAPAPVTALQREALRPSPATAATATTIAPPAELPAPVRRLEAATAAEALTPLARLPLLTTRAPVADTSAPPVDLPAPVQRLEAAEAAPLTRLAPSARPALPASSAPAGNANSVASDLPPPVAAPAGNPLAPPVANALANPLANPLASAGSPDAGSRLGADRATPPSAAASAVRAPLNLALPRGDIAARRSTGVLGLLPQPPERKSKLETEVEAAAKADCRKAYAETGLLAVVPLVMDAARSKGGCRW